MTQTPRHAAAANHVLVIWHQHNTANYTTWCHTMGPVMSINKKPADTHIQPCSPIFTLFWQLITHDHGGGNRGRGWEEVRQWECVTSPVFHTHRKQGWQTGKCHSRAGRLWQNFCHNSNQSTGWEQRVGWKRQEFNYNSTLHIHVGTMLSLDQLSSRFVFCNRWVQLHAHQYFLFLEVSDYPCDHVNSIIRYPLSKKKKKKAIIRLWGIQ